MTYAHKYGDFARLTNGIDWLGNVCGSGNTTEYPYLYWCGPPTTVLDAWSGFPSSLSLKLPICVESCPTDTSGTVFCAGPPEPGPEIVTDGYIMTKAFELSNTQKITGQHTYPTIAL